MEIEKQRHEMNRIESGFDRLEKGRLASSDPAQDGGTQPAIARILCREFGERSDGKGAGAIAECKGEPEAHAWIRIVRELFHFALVLDVFGNPREFVTKSSWFCGTNGSRGNNPPNSA